MLWDNPIWTYRIRARWWRRLSPSARGMISRAALWLGAAGSAAVAGWVAWVEWGNPGGLSGWVSGGGYLIYSAVAAIWAGVSGALAVVPERHQGTWDNLIVSRLSAREIVLGKFAAAVWPVALFALWTLPIWAAAMAAGATYSSHHWVVGPWLCLRALARPLAQRQNSSGTTWA